ncbi:MAG: metalloregulator ArsR/SmtB family transcription factor [Anaerolineae bacterium]|nr:metalloregulator ArsR/SmtB family transcription factor [Anaerolineae bacterium]
MHTQLFEELVMLHNRVCLALGDPKRLVILYILNGGAHSVNELALLLEMPQPTVSHHLKILRERSIVKTQRDGTTVYYSLADIRVIQALDLLREVLHDTVQRQAELAAFTAVDAERQDADDEGSEGQS